MEKELNNKKAEKLIYVSKTYPCLFYGNLEYVLFNKSGDVDINEIYYNEHRLRYLVEITHFVTIKLCIDKPAIKASDIKTKCFERNGVKAICFQLPDPIYECQAKYIAFLYNDKKSLYYSAELYEETNTLGIGYKDKDGCFFETSNDLKIDDTIEGFVDTVFKLFQL